MTVDRQALSGDQGLNFPRTLRTARLLLRAPTSDDIEHLVRIYGDEQVTACGGESPYPPDVCQDILAFWLDMWAREGMGYFCVARIGSPDDVIGFAGVAVTDYPGQFNLFLWFGWQAWGHGFARESGCACLDLAFDGCGAEAIVASTSAFNSRSKRALQAIGLREVWSERPGRASFLLTRAGSGR